MENDKTENSVASNCYRALLIIQLIGGLVVVSLGARSVDNLESFWICFAMGNAFAQMFPPRGLFVIHGSNVPWDKSR